MIEIPESVEIRPELIKDLRNLENKQKSIQQMIGMIQQQCEQKLVEYNDLMKTTWVQIQSETGVDMERIIWVPHPTENKIVPAQIKLVTPQAG